MAVKRSLGGGIITKGRAAKYSHLKCNNNAKSFSVILGSKTGNPSNLRPMNYNGHRRFTIIIFIVRWPELQSCHSMNFSVIAAVI